MRATFENVHFSHNGATEGEIHGAAVRAEACAADNVCPASPVLRFQSCTFEHNRASKGGAIFAEDADIVINQSTFSKNTAVVTGGAVYFRNSQNTTLTIEGSTFENNTAGSEEGEEIALNAGPLDLFNFSSLEAGRGGAVFAHSPMEISIRRSVFSDNLGCRGGGAIAVLCNQMDMSEIARRYRIDDSRFERNAAICETQHGFELPEPFLRAPHVGGALAHEALDSSSRAWTLKNISFLDNVAVNGGALSFRSFSAVTGPHRISTCTFRSNIAMRRGGSISQDTSHLTIVNTTFLHSRALYGGSIEVNQNAILNFETDPEDISLLSYIENSTALYGGGLFSDSAGKCIDLSFSKQMIDVPRRYQSRRFGLP